MLQRHSRSPRVRLWLPFSLVTCCLLVATAASSQSTDCPEFGPPVPKFWPQQSDGSAPTCQVNVSPEARTKSNAAALPVPFGSGPSSCVGSGDIRAGQPNPNLASDPVQVSSGSSFVDDVDVAIPSSGLEFRTYYTSRDSIWDQTFNESFYALDVSAPWGRGPSKSYKTLRWWHNWFSFVDVWYDRKATIPTWSYFVRAPGGGLFHYLTCTAPCVAQPYAPQEDTPVLVVERPDKFVLFYKDGQRFVYDAYSQLSDPSTVLHYFLSDAYDRSGDRIAHLVYASPPNIPGLGHCDSGWTYDNAAGKWVEIPGAGVPFIKRIYDREGAAIELTWTQSPDRSAC